MSTQPGVGLPPQLAALLDAAISEAKRRGHGQVSPAHVSSILAREGVDVALPGETVAQMNRYLDSLPRTYDRPEVAPDTIAMLQACAVRPDPLAGLGAELIVRAAGLDSPDAPARAGNGFVLNGEAARVAEVVPTKPPVVMRDEVVRQVLAALEARSPQAPVVVAPEGEGRSGLARCLAATLAAPAYAGRLAGWPVVRVRSHRIAAEARGQAVSSVLEACRGSAVVYVDDVEVLVGLGTGRIDLDVLAVLRAALEDEHQLVALAVAAQFVDRLQAADIEFFDELVRIDLSPFTAEQVRAVATAAAAELAEFHRVSVGQAVVDAAVSPAGPMDRQGQPSLAITRLDRAASAAALTPQRVAEVADLGAPARSQERQAIDPVSARVHLKQQVLGQDEAIDAIMDRLALTRVSLDTKPERPDGVFLLAGPTGTGKTALALALAEGVFGTAEALIRVDMSELAEWEAVTKLIGPPPGYVGSMDPESWLTTKVRRRPQALLLLDEIEKAHPLVWNTFLQVFDAGRLTDSQGRVADFRDVICILTTNIGAEAFADRRAPGFVEGVDTATADEGQVREEIRRWMRPELINRLDDILVFRPLSPETVRSIVVAQVATATSRLAERGWVVECDDGVVDVLCALGYSREYGARPLLRALEEHFLGPIGQLPRGPVKVTAVDGRIVVAASA